MNGSMLGALGRANGWVTLWLGRIASVALAVIAAVTFVDVVGRYFFRAAFPFTVELTQLAMAIVVYFGVGLVTHEDAHISADVVTPVPPVTKTWSAHSTWFTDSPRTWRTPSAMPFIPWM